MLTCRACQQLFNCFDAQKEHFREDWHRYNLKRKVAGLIPVTKAQFDHFTLTVQRGQQLKIALDPKQKQLQKRAEELKTRKRKVWKCQTCANKTFSSEKAFQNHLLSKKHIAGTNASSNNDPIVSFQSMDPLEEEYNDDDETLEEQMESISVHDCIFCNFQGAHLEDNLKHMLEEHGFFIPDQECVVDLEGLLRYLAQKVKCGHVCLYCNGKIFQTFQDVQKHMRDLSHCKICYDECDLDEYLDYYDYSKNHDDGEDIEWETESEVSDDDNVLVVAEKGRNPILKISETGELILLDGQRRLGHREFRRYYKQKFGSKHDALAVCNPMSLVKQRNNISDGQSIAQQRRQVFLADKHRDKFRFRSHKLQRNPNRRAMITV
uniref:Uncharacterized protein AlNc14C35G3137 n=1 Tax=Albugo laibachii Nc14 TaxID=890382 RepID=F0W8L1_9STRA|nr:conserved hypothetical protein [Albugo laibachii Nc14]|eukprot:CCA17466.1 conserved hypothetical protein [Albugo laibachii Nc14]